MSTEASVEHRFQHHPAGVEGHRSPYVLLETRRCDRENYRTFYFDRPVEVLTFHPGGDPAAFFARIDEGLKRGLWVAGYFGYEFGYCLEPKLRGLLGPGNPSGPLAWLGFFKGPAIVDHRSDRGGCSSGAAAFAPPVDSGYEIRDLELSATRDEYRRAVSRIKSYLTDGDTYQVNFTLKYRFTLKGMPEALYLGLRDRQTVAHSACLSDGCRTVISFSPELFLKKDGRSLQVKPMKGTVRRGRTLEEDEELADWLAGDPKNRAENVMIVDMVRNDLGRIAAPGTVRVPRLLEVERYETLFQMTSTVNARLEPGTSWHRVMKALFPCGSVTGAPKLRTMEIIAELEVEPRGVYTGAIGYISPGGRACFSVAIRTIVIDPQNRGEMGIGSGIVYDSEPSAEYEECILKAKFLEQKRPRFSLVETMLLENGSIALLEAHLQRIQASARYFDFVCPLEKVEAALRQLAGRRGGGRHKIRLLLHRSGDFDVSADPLDRVGSSVRFIKVSDTRTDSMDPFLYHKTTCRPLYERERRRALAAGFGEVVFVNERDEITEGAISNVFLERSGTLYTPPVSSGLLPGTLRKKLLEEGRCRECVLRLGDLRRADKIYLGNSVEGLAAAAYRG